MTVDYSLYLVTDSTPAILGDENLAKIVEAAVQGGVTIVQYRDKSSDTGILIQNARELHAITKRLGVPLLINDRVDVALAIGAEGVHIGQDDMNLATARQLLGDKAIIGVTASSPAEAMEAAEGGADYIGLGTVFATPTKENTKSIAGPSGIREMLSALASNPKTARIKTVCIGGINSSNVKRVLHQTESTNPAKKLDGVAVVSAIISSPDPRATAQELRSLIASPAPFSNHHQPNTPITRLDLPTLIPPILLKVIEKGPLCHNMTNLVVQNIAANVALCIGASPIMSNNGHEAGDLAKLGGSLVVNMGTVTPEMLDNYTMAVTAYNKAGGPILLDPVGCGATAARKAALRKMMDTGVFAVIKGNEGEMKALALLTDPTAMARITEQRDDKQATTQQHGVDSGPSTLTIPQKATLARSLALTHKTIIVITGEVDVLSSAHQTLTISNGHPYLGAVTGSGCCLGTAIAAYEAVCFGDRFAAALAALLHYEIAAERAAGRGDVKGPGSFVPAFLDELFAIREETRRGEVAWLEGARVEVVEVEGEVLQ